MIADVEALCVTFLPTAGWGEILQGKREGGPFLFYGLVKAFYWRRFKRIEDAPLAAYVIFT
jgi:hypothetical protein